MADLNSEITRVTRERDFYRRLLELGSRTELDPLLEEALSLIIDATGAQKGYLELSDDDADDEPCWFIAKDCSPQEVTNIRNELSSGIIAEAIASGRTVQTASAQEDPRFDMMKSVRHNRIDAVLCAPVGESLGVVYLQGPRGHEPFSPDDQALVESFATHLAPLADRLLMQHRQASADDPTVPFRDKLRADGLVGCGEAMAKVLEQVSLVAPLDVHVLLTGPSGSGKTAVAKVIAANSPRHEGPFVELNCAALPENLVENELFGAMPGAHSTASKKVDGKVLAAEGGTLFLDEIGELPHGAQAKLLQLLQSKKYYPLGGNEPVTADVRIIAATNADLEAAVANKKFREDLLYRLQVLPIRMPSLSERPEDLRLLANHFVRAICNQHDLPHARLSPSAVIAVETAEWPGNVRQLANALEAAVIRAQPDGGQVIESRHVFPEEKSNGKPPGDDLDVSFHTATRRFQSRFIESALEATDWNITETAKRLDLARSHVYNLIRDFGLRRDK